MYPYGVMRTSVTHWNYNVLGGASLTEETLKDFKPLEMDPTDTQMYVVDAM